MMKFVILLGGFLAGCLMAQNDASSSGSTDSTPVGNEVDFIRSSQTYGAIQQNCSIDGKPLQIAGEKFETGIGVHAISEFPAMVPKGTVRLTGAVGVADEVPSGKASVQFKILSGNAVLWESPKMSSGMKAVPFDIPVFSVYHRQLYFQVTDCGENSYDHANWVNLKWHKGTQPKLKAAQIFKGAQFGLTPNTEEDQTIALRKAFQALREVPGSTLLLEPGTYHFWYTNALPRHYHASNHDQPNWHPVSVPLVDLKNVTIDGQKSKFLFHGRVQPMFIQDSENVKIKDIALDYAIPNHAQGIITAIDSNNYEMFIDQKKYPHVVKNQWFTFKGDGWDRGDAGFGIIFDGKTKAIVANTPDYNYRGKLTVLNAEEGRYRVQKNLQKDNIKKGDAISLRLGWGRPHPAVVLYRAKNTYFHNFSIHQSDGMGMLAQRSENIYINGGGVHLEKGSSRYFTTNADATHFSNCKGEIISENSLYEGMMDDAINVHATCLRIIKKNSPTEILCRYQHYQAVGFEVVEPGEEIRFIQAKYLTPGEKVKVKSVKRLSTQEILIGLEQPMPADIKEGDAIENAEWFPSVVFRKNMVRHNRARGSLFTTPKSVLVEDNVFDYSAGSAILLAGDANGWYESGACEDVIIKNNVFRNNLTSRYQFTEALIAIYPEVPDLKNQKEFYHRNVIIENNKFDTFDVPLLFAISTKNIVFKNNQINYNNDFKSWGKKPFIFRRCDQIKIQNNTITGRNKTQFDIKDVELRLTDSDSISFQ